MLDKSTENKSLISQLSRYGKRDMSHSCNLLLLHSLIVKKSMGIGTFGMLRQ